MTIADVEAFLAERKAEALRIDPEICEGMSRHVQVMDPYGLLDLPEEDRCIGRDIFVRNPNGPWVWFGDLPDGVLEAAQAREKKRTTGFHPPISRSEKRGAVGRLKSQLRFGQVVWPETREASSHHVGLTIAARRLAESTLAELTRLGVSVAIDEGKARFRATRAMPPTAKRIIETHGDLLEAFLKEGQV